MRIPTGVGCGPDFMSIDEKLEARAGGCSPRGDLGAARLVGLPLNEEDIGEVDGAQAMSALGTRRRAFGAAG